MKYYWPGILMNLMIFATSVKTQRHSTLWLNASSSSYSSYGIQDYGSSMDASPTISSPSSSYEWPSASKSSNSTSSSSPTFRSRNGIPADDENPIQVEIVDNSTMSAPEGPPITIGTLLVPKGDALPSTSSFSPPITTPVTPPSDEELFNFLITTQQPPPNLVPGSTTMAPTVIPTDVTALPPDESSLPYPTYQRIPLDLNVSCAERLDGYYADQEAECQIWHWCLPGGRHYTFLCPERTMFNQAFLVCDWWYNVDCSKAEELYIVNERLFGSPEQEEE